MYQGPVPDIWLITGPGDLRRAAARALAARLERAAHVDGNALWEQIVAGRETPRDERSEEVERQYELVIRNQCLLARSYAEAGFVPVLDFQVASQHHLDAYRNYLLGGRLHLVVLAPAGTGDLDDLDDLAELGLWLDAHGLDPEAAAEAMLARAEEAVLPAL